MKGRVLFVELKGKKGKLSKEQKELRLIFHYLGHEIHKINSFANFIGLTNG